MRAAASVMTYQSKVGVLNKSALAEIIERETHAAELLEALKGLMEYRCHVDGCAIDQTDFCTCGLKEVADKARAAIARAQPNAAP